MCVNSEFAKMSLCAQNATCKTPCPEKLLCMLKSLKVSARDAYMTTKREIVAKFETQIAEIKAQREALLLELESKYQEQTFEFER